MSLLIQQNFDFIIDKLSEFNENLMLHAYFDFLGDFIKTHYNNFTQDNLIKFMQSLVKRIQSELATQENRVASGKGKKKTLKAKEGKITGGVTNTKANIRINKCWNTIRFIAEHEYFAEVHLTIIEETLLPLFEYLV